MTAQLKAHLSRFQQDFSQLRMFLDLVTHPKSAGPGMSRQDNYRCLARQLKVPMPPHWPQLLTPTAMTSILFWGTEQSAGN